MKEELKLPDPSMELEGQFIAELMDEDLETCVEAIQLAISAKRPKLAGKIFAILKEPVEMDEDLRKAERALAFFLINQTEEDWDEFQDIWEEYRENRKLRRFKARHRPQSNFGTRSW